MESVEQKFDSQIDTSIQRYRESRRIVPFISDYLPDQRNLPHDERVAYYKQLKEDLGIHTVRTEFRMRHMMNEDGSLNKDVVDSYRSALLAMKEAKLEPPIIYLFSPPKWFIELEKSNTDQLRTRFKAYAIAVKELYRQVGFQPSHIQVMSEVNLRFHTPLSFKTLGDLLDIAGEVFERGKGGPKIMTTLHVGNIDVGTMSESKNWKEFIYRFMKEHGSRIDALGVDYYPGSYEYPAGIPVIGKQPFEAFGGKTPYEWISQQKENGILQGKDIIIAEIGVPAITSESKFARFGYDRIVQSLDHFLLTQEQKGIQGHDLIRAIGFFAGAEFPNVYTMVPGGLDFHPWTLLRKTKDGKWAPTNAGRRLKHLIETRIYTEK